MVHRPMRGWHCQSLGKVCWGNLVAFHFPTGPARADHVFGCPFGIFGHCGFACVVSRTHVISWDLDSPIGCHVATVS